MEKIKIETTQNVDIEFPVASIGERILAALIDYIILFIFAMVVSAYISPLLVSYGDESTLGTMLMFIMMFFLVFYQLLCELLFNGQSFGKMAMRIRVIKTDGTKPTLGSYFLRWILRIVEEWTTLGAVSIITILVNGKGQRLGDIAASTVVVRIKPLVSLDDTLFAKLEENYEPVFPEVSVLTEQDITLVNDLLLANGEKDVSTAVRRANFTAKKSLEEKMNVKTDIPPIRFFNILIKDYNSIHGL